MDILERYAILTKTTINTIAAIKKARELHHGEMLDRFMEDIPGLMMEHAQILIECQKDEHFDLPTGQQIGYNLASKLQS